jgi:hypothetical protein
MPVTFPIDCLDCGGKLYAFGDCPNCKAIAQNKTIDNEPHVREETFSPKTENRDASIPEYQEMLIFVRDGSLSDANIQFERALRISKMGFTVRIRKYRGR